jgi:hypothetical protein
MIELATRAASTVQEQATSIVLAVEADSGIWTVKLKTGRAVILRASDSKAFKAAGLIALVAAEASVVMVDLAAVTGSVAVVDSVAVALGALAAAEEEDFAAAEASEVDAKINALTKLEFLGRTNKAKNTYKGKI